MEASEMSSMTETATGDPAVKKEDGDSRRTAVFVAICCGIALALLLAVAAGSALGPQENAEKGTTDDGNGHYIDGHQGGGSGGGKVTTREATTAASTKQTSKAETTKEAPTEPTEPPTTTTTEEPMPEKDRTGVFCVSGGTKDFYPIPEDTIFQLCRRVVGRLGWYQRDSEKRVLFDVYFVGYINNTPAYDKHKELFYWPWSYETILNYRKPTFFVDINIKKSNVPTTGYGLSNFPLKVILESSYLSQYLETLGDVRPEKMVLVIDASVPEMQVIKEMDTSKLNRVGYIILAQNTFVCKYQGYWNVPEFKEYAKALNRALRQPILFSGTAAVLELDNYNDATKNECDTATVEPDHWRRCDHNPELNGTYYYDEGLIECDDVWFGFETEQSLKRMTAFVKATKMNCALYNFEYAYRVDKRLKRNTSVIVDCS